MEPVTTKTTTKRPFLRKGTGLRRFYKDLDIDSHFQSFCNANSRKYSSADEEDPKSGIEKDIPHSVLKSSDSPKRNLNVRFSKASAGENTAAGSSNDYRRSSARALDFSDDKENRTPNPVRAYQIEKYGEGFVEMSLSGTEDSGTEEQSTSDEEWETDEERNEREDEESVVEIDESIVDEVFRSILRNKAEKAQIPGPSNPLTKQSEDRAGVLKSLPQSNKESESTTCVQDHNSYGRFLTSKESKENIDIQRLPWKLSSDYQPQSYSLPSDNSTSVRELEMFEKMERITSNQSFCSTASTVQRFVNTELNISPLPEPINSPTPPQVHIPSQALPPSCPNLPQGRSSGKNNSIEARKEQLRSDPQYLQTLLNTRIRQLEVQIEKHITENKRIAQLRDQLDNECMAQESARKVFERRHAKELEIIDELKQRLKADREKVNYELSKVRKQKNLEETTEDEMQTLRSKVTELEKELKVRSSRWAASARNLKATIADLRKENERLEKSVEGLRAEKFKLNLRLRKKSSQLPVPNVEQEACSKVKNVDPFSPIPSIPPTTTLPTLPKEPENLSEEKSVTDENGTTRLLSAEGQCLEIRYPNGDIKDLRFVESQGITKYFYKAADSWEIIYSDGTEMLRFGSGEVQTKFPNGTREIQYVTGAVRRIFTDGTEECVSPDKTLIRTEANGDCQIHLPNGQIEYQTKNLKIRVFPDGTEKVLYNDGSSLTRFASGRQRFRDASGQIVFDQLPDKGKTTTP